MKTIADLFEVMAQAVTENNKEHNTWFFDFYGHTERLEIQHYHCGWSEETKDIIHQAKFSMNEDGIQAAYWFIKAKIK